MQAYSAQNYFYNFYQLNTKTFFDRIVLYLPKHYIDGAWFMERSEQLLDNGDLQCFLN